MRRAHIIVILAVTLATSCLYGQWKQLASFNSQIVSVHFLSGEGHRELGFVGLANGKVWMTTNHGTQWTLSATPAFLSGRITSFTFKDSLVGWFSAAEDATVPCVYKTYDGGLNWIPDTLYGVGTSITYNRRANPRTLILTTWSKYNMVSTNEGLSWYRLGQKQEMCGVAINDKNFGIMSAAQSKTMTLTSDGGKTWRTLLNTTTEMWNPLAINGTNMFFAVAELGKQIWRGDNSGDYWEVIFQFSQPGQAVDLTGWIGGTLNALYVQAKNGLYVSTNQGQAWREFCGPGNDYDTRMFVSGDTIYAGTVDGKLFVNTYGVSRLKDLVEFSTDRINFTSTGCIRLDSAVKLINQSTCLKVKIESIKIEGDNVAFGTGAGDLKPLGLIDSIRISYIPNDLKIDTANLIVKYSIGDQIFEKRIRLTGNGKPGINLTLSKEFEMLLASDCAKLDTFITIKNGPCDSVSLVWAAVTDPTTFTLTTGNLPETVFPNGTIKVSLAVNTVTPGDYTTKVYLRFTSNGVVVDTSIDLKLKVLSAKDPFVTFSKETIRFDSVSTCDIRYDTVIITNTICKQLSLESVNITFDPALKAIHLPGTPKFLRPNESDTVIVSYAPEAETPLSAQITIRTAFGPSEQRDTIVQVTGFGKAFGDATLTAPALTFEPMLECEENELVSALINLSCDSATVIGIENAADAGFQVIEPALLTEMASGDTIPVRIHVGPISDGSKFDSIRIRIRTRSGAERLVKLTLLGTVNPRERSLGLPDSIHLDSIPPCVPLDTFVYIVNRGKCDTLWIDSVMLKGASWVTRDSLSLPLRLLPSDSILVPLHFDPPPNGQSSGWIQFTGKGIDTAIALRLGTGAYIDPMPLAISDSNFAAFLCKNAKRDIELSNPLCDTLVIDDLTILGSNAQFKFVSGVTLPIKLAPGEVVSVAIEFDPSAIGDSTALLRVGSTRHGIIKSIGLTGSYRNTKGQARVEAIFPNGLHAIAIGANNYPVVDIRANSAIEKARDLSVIECIVSFNDNVLTVADIKPQNGWRLVRRQDNTGEVLVRLKRDAISDIALFDNIASITFWTTVGDSTWSPVAITDVKLNPDDSIYHSCVLQPLALGPIRIDITDTCGDAFIRRWMNHDPDIFDEFSIRPNPTDGSDDISVSFNLRFDRDVLLSVFDANGKRIEAVPFAGLRKGPQKLRLKAPSLPEGWCFITIECAEQRDLQKLILRK